MCTLKSIVFCTLLTVFYIVFLKFEIWFYIRAKSSYRSFGQAANEIRRRDVRNMREVCSKCYWIL